MSFDRLHAMCQSARVSANVPVINVTVPGISAVQAAESSNMYSTLCCESTALRKFVIQINCCYFVVHTLLLSLMLLVRAVVKVRLVICRINNELPQQVQDGSVDIRSHYLGQLVDVVDVSG